MPGMEVLVQPLQRIIEVEPGANLLEALSGYARWCQAQASQPGRSAAAAQALATVLAHPALHAELRDELQCSPLATLPAVPAADLLALVETASADLTRAAQAEASSAAPGVPAAPPGLRST